MDVIPASTHAAELAATVDDLAGGLELLPLSKAVNRIDDWRRELLATERADLRAIADDLGKLHHALTGERLDGRAIGRLLVSLGEATADAADDGTDKAVRSGLLRLASLLRHAGHALAGNAAGAGPDPAGDGRPSTAG